MGKDQFSQEEMLLSMNAAAETFVTEIVKLTFKYGIDSKDAREVAQIALDDWFSALSKTLTTELLDEVLDDGKIVKLMNGTVWSIRLGDNTRTNLWHSTQHIEVSKDEAGSYFLKNLDTFEQETIVAQPV